jgi:glycosyltransferase involved in cell wall biosynthesis
MMIEAMACGITGDRSNRGPVPATAEPGGTGMIGQDEAAAVAALLRVASLSRAAVRRSFERRFTAQRMAEDYLALYRRLAVRARPTLRIVR